MGRKTKNPPPDPSTFANQTPFRAVERKYKQRCEDLELSEVFDYRQWAAVCGEVHCPLCRPAHIAEVVSGGCGNDDRDHIHEESLPPRPHPKGRPPFAAPVRLQTPLGKEFRNSFPDLVSEHEAGREGPGNTLGFVFPGYPGLLYVPNALTPRLQKFFVRQSLKEYTCPPNLSNLSAHWEVPAQGLWKECMDYADNAQAAANGCSHNVSWEEDANEDEDLIALKPANNSGAEASGAYRATPPVHLKPESASALFKRMRWCTLGYQYEWSTKSYIESTRYQFPPDLAQLTRCVAAATETVAPEEDWLPGCECQWGTGYPGCRYVAQAGVLNLYGSRDTLMAHVDQSEPFMGAPLISFSLAADGVFLIGGPTRATTPIALRLRSGDIVIMAGPARHAFHGVPRILEGCIPDWTVENHGKAESEAPENDGDREWQMMLSYIRSRNVRVNLNVRQVFE